MVIDIHAHAYPENIVKKVRERMEQVSGCPVSDGGTPEALVESMREAGIDCSIFLPVATSPKQVGKLNAQAMRWMERYGERGLLSFAAMHPDTVAKSEVLRGVRSGGLKGIKIHPDYQDTYFDDIRYLRLLDAAAEQEIPVLVHAGMDEVYPDHIHCDVARILKVLRELKGGTLILAHMGGWQMWDQVEEYLCGAPVYFDTAFSLTGTVSVEGKKGFGSMLDDERFVRLVRKHGAENILFGTDTPWSNPKENLEWIHGCSLTAMEKQAILGENARKVLKIGENN